MTDGSAGEQAAQQAFDIPDDVDEVAAEARRVADRLRRRKRALERRNPLNDLDEYRRRFREVVELEGQLRVLREAGELLGDDDVDR